MMIIQLTSLLFLLLISPSETYTLNGAQYAEEADDGHYSGHDSDEKVIVATLVRLDAARVVILPLRTAKFEFDTGGRAKVKLCLANVATIFRCFEHAVNLVTLEQTLPHYFLD